MAKPTVTQYASLFKDLDTKSRELDGLLFDASLLNQALIHKIRSVYDPLQDQD